MGKPTTNTLDIGTQNTQRHGNKYQGTGTVTGTVTGKGTGKGTDY